MSKINKTSNFEIKIQRLNKQGFFAPISELVKKFGNETLYKKKSHYVSDHASVKILSFWRNDQQRLSFALMVESNCCILERIFRRGMFSLINSNPKDCYWNR